MKGSNLKTRKIGWHSTLEFQEGAVQVRQKQKCLELCSDPDSKEKPCDELSVLGRA